MIDRLIGFVIVLSSIIIGYFMIRHLHIIPI